MLPVGVYKSPSVAYANRIVSTWSRWQSALPILVDQSQSLVSQLVSNSILQFQLSMHFTLVMASVSFRDDRNSLDDFNLNCMPQTCWESLSFIHTSCNLCAKIPEELITSAHIFDLLHAHCNQLWNQFYQSVEHKGRHTQYVDDNKSSLFTIAALHFTRLLCKQSAKTFSCCLLLEPYE